MIYDLVNYDLISTLPVVSNNKVRILLIKFYACISMLLQTLPYSLHLVIDESSFRLVY